MRVRKYTIKKKLNENNIWIIIKNNNKNHIIVKEKNIYNEYRQIQTYVGNI